MTNISQTIVDQTKEKLEAMRIAGVEKVVLYINSVTNSIPLGTSGGIVIDTINQAPNFEQFLIERIEQYYRNRYNERRLGDVTGIEVEEYFTAA